MFLEETSVQSLSSERKDLNVSCPARLRFCWQHNWRTCISCWLLGFPLFSTPWATLNEACVLLLGSWPGSPPLLSSSAWLSDAFTWAPEDMPHLGSASFSDPSWGNCYGNSSPDISQFQHSSTESVREFCQSHVGFIILLWETLEKCWEGQKSDVEVQVYHYTYRFGIIYLLWIWTPNCRTDLLLESTSWAPSGWSDPSHLIQLVLAQINSWKLNVSCRDYY